jgi:S-formylglutathione hydrolase FrmB
VTPTPAPTISNAPTGTPASTPTITPTPLPTATPLPGGQSDLFSSEFFSKAMNQNMPFQIYLPPGYRESQRRYAVVYLLHGWGGDFGEWGWYGAQSTADDLIRGGEIPPFIIVTPEGDKAYWFNHFNGPLWGDYVWRDLVEFIDANYRTLPKRSSRAIGGLSMGALGAMQLTLNHPDEFSLVGMRSPTLREVQDPDKPDFFGDEAYYKAYDPLALIQLPNAAAPDYTYVIQGDKDIWLGRTRDFLKLMDARHAKYELHIHPGDHDGVFFGEYLDEDMRFFGAHIDVKD